MGKTYNLAKDAEPPGDRRRQLGRHLPRSPRPGNGPTPSAGSSAPSAPTWASAAATTTRRWSARPSPSRCASSCRTARTISTSTPATGGWPTRRWHRLLEFAGYDVKHVWGDGAHNGKHGGRDPSRRPALALAGLSLRPSGPAGASKQPVTDILVPGEDWQLVSEGTDSPRGRPRTPRARSSSPTCPGPDPQVGLDGKVDLFERTRGRDGLMFGPDGRLYAARTARSGSWPIDATGKRPWSPRASARNDLVVNHKGGIYVTDPGSKQVWFVSARARRVVDNGVTEPNGVIPDAGPEPAPRGRTAGTVRLFLPDPARRFTGSQAALLLSSSGRGAPTAGPTGWPWTRTGICTSPRRWACRTATRPAG